MSDQPDALSAQRTTLVESIVACMRQPRDGPDPAAVIDRRELRLLAVGDGDTDTHIRWCDALRDPERYAPVPSRDLVETIEQVGAFIEDEYAPTETDVYRQAFDALQDADSAADWRNLLGVGHDAVLGFDRYIRDFHSVVARMLMHGSSRPHVGMLGTDRIRRLTVDEA